MNVFEFIKEKRTDFKDNTEQYRIMLEPKFKSLSNKINNRITNTLNNPWISNIISINGSTFFGQKHPIPNGIVKDSYDQINKSLGKEIFVGEWEAIDQDCINRFADLTGDRQWIHTDLKKAKLESPFKTNS
jgi:hypothetical protein